MDDLQIYGEITRLMKERIPAALAILVETGGTSSRQAGAKMVVRSDGSISGTVGGGRVEAETITAALETIRQGRPRTLSFSSSGEDDEGCGGKMQIFLEPLFAPPHLVVVGTGHVGQAVGGAAQPAGFLITLLRTVPSPSPETGSEVIPYHPVEELEVTFKNLGIDSNSYIFIATSDHHRDFQATAAALKTEARYIGLLGSNRKRAALEKYLLERGFTSLDIGRITSPAGVEIGAETPAEIAVSVVAQMIGARRAAGPA